MDGPEFDGIRVASNSLIQSFTEYHDNSCARLTALQNSRVWDVDLKAGEEQSVLLRVLCVRSGCLLEKAFFFPAAVKKVA